MSDSIELQTISPIAFLAAPAKVSAICFLRGVRLPINTSMKVLAPSISKTRSKAILFPVPPDTGADVTPALREVLTELAKQGGGRIEFSPGRYDFWPDRAFEKYLFVSNNDEGLKRIAFHLENLSEVEIDGQGAEFIFHGFLTPFAMENCSRVTLRDFSVDYARPFSSEGEILEVDPDAITVRFPEQHPYRIEGDELVFLDADGVRYPWGRLLEFDPVKREPAYMALDYWGKSFVTSGMIPADEKGSFLSAFRASDCGDRCVRVEVPGIHASVGNIMYFGPDHRRVPGIFLNGCSDVTIADVTIHHSGGMAAIAQKCKSVAFSNYRVLAKPGTGRIVSATADATHFVNCTGKIRLDRCRMESQMDDATNIHGNYATIDRIAGPRCIELRFMHSQHAGFPLLAAGDSAAFSDGRTLHPLGGASVRAVNVINRDLLAVHLADDLPPGIAPGTLVHNGEQTAPEVEITDCVFTGNRARGILLGSAGKTRVAGNIFHNPGAAILLEGDGKTWFEQAAVRDLTITGNRFENCNFGVWGNAVIEISSPHLDEKGLGERCHRNITIVGNTFVSFDGTPLLVAKGAEGLVFERNNHEQSDAYPPCRMAAAPFFLEYCSQASITLDSDGNRMSRDKECGDAVS